MSPETPSAGVDLSQLHLAHSSSSPPSLPLKEALKSCSDSFEAGDFAKSDKAVAAVVDILDEITTKDDSSSSDNLSEAALVEIEQYLSSPDSNQMAVEALSLALPKVVVKFASLSDKCKELAERIIDQIISICNPRDMLSIMCEALDTDNAMARTLIGDIILLNGLSKVLLSIKRRHVEQVKEAFPVILRVLNTVSSESDEEDKDSLNDLFTSAISISTSLKAICQKLEGRTQEELRAILGLYVLHNIALISRSKRALAVSTCNGLVLRFSQFLPFCCLSYFGLVTGCDVDVITCEITKVDDDDNFVDRFSFAIDGASLAVIWGHISKEVAKAAGEQLSNVLTKIRKDTFRRWQAVGMLKPVLSSIDYPWEIKHHAIDLLSEMMDGRSFGESVCSVDFSSFMPTLFAVLKAIERLMIGTPDSSLRKKAFGALRMIVSNLPSCERLDILKALITNSNSPSMIAILIDLVREEAFMESQKERPSTNDENRSAENNMAISPFWSPDVLGVVELVLKPPTGGPPTLPEYSEPVLSALNLYRFILIRESAGKTNHTGVLSKNTLQKAYKEWLLPLRTLVLRFQAENKDGGEFADSVLCAIDPVQMVLYRCIELVEARVKHSE